MEIFWVITEISGVRKNPYSHIDRGPKIGQIDLIMSAESSQLSAALQDALR